MSKKAFTRSTFFAIAALLITTAILMPCFSVSASAVTYPADSATEETWEETPATTSDTTVIYDSRPILERFFYQTRETIPIEIDIEADSPIFAVEYSASGFVVSAPLRAENGKVLGDMTYDGSCENPQLTVTVELANGKRLCANIYGYAADETVYLNVNSFFCAKDIYWSEMLKSGTLTQADYEEYLKNLSPMATTVSEIASDSSASVTATQYQITISGTLQWRDDWGTLHPLQYTKVVVMHDAWLPALDKELGTGYTDQSGHYSISFTHSGACKPYLKVYPEGENTVVQTGAGDAYMKASATYSNVTSNQSIDLIIDMSNEIGRAFQVSQAFITASRFIKVVNGNYIRPVTVKYPHNIANEKGCFYRNTEETIYIIGNYNNDDGNNLPVINGVILRSYAAWDVLYHEFFHHVQKVFAIADNPGGWHVPELNMYIHYMSHHDSSFESKSCLDKSGKITCKNPPANKAKEKAIKIAYAEGVATVLSGIAQQYWVNTGNLNNIKTVGDSQYLSYNGLRIDCESTGMRSGEACEGSVIGILWDIYDYNSDTNDHVSLGYQRFWDLLVEYPNKTLSEFIETFYEMYPNEVDSLGSNLTFYKVAPSPLGASCYSLYALPTFQWTPYGSSDSKYKNNIFKLQFYNESKTPIGDFITTGTSHAFTESDWSLLLSLSSSYFYWQIEACQEETVIKDNGAEEKIRTGPYYTALERIEKPSATTIEDVYYNTISQAGEYQWYRFVAPSEGQYEFFTEGTTDTYGDLFLESFYGLNPSGRLAYDDNSGENSNFKITYQLHYQQTVYLRVRAVGEGTGDYTLKVVFHQHSHSYQARYELHDNIFYHRSYCDCGEYILEEHTYGITKKSGRYCLYCHKKLNVPPGGEIMSLSIAHADALLPKKQEF